MQPRILFFLMLCHAIVTRNQDHLLAFVLAENAVLREIVRPHRYEITNAQRTRLATAAKALGRARLRMLDLTFKPDTMLKWYRLLVASKYTPKQPRSPGRPHTTAADVAHLVVRCATENPGWGYTRIRDTLYHLGHDLGRNTICRILKAHGIEPAPTRSKRMAWATFLKLHWGAITAADFFTIEVLTPRGLVRYFAFIVIDLKTRRVELAGLSHTVDGRWMCNVAKGLLDRVDGFLLGKTKLILDRDPLYTKDFRNLLEGAGIEAVRLPARSPNLNAYAERVIRSIRQECLSKIIPLSGAHLRHAITQYLAHDHLERPHQGLGGKLIETGDRPVEIDIKRKVKRRQRLGGLLNSYYRDAA